MKTKIPVFYFLLVFFILPMNAVAVYDLLSMDLTPTDNDIQFCFYPDYRKDANTYLAALINDVFYFISKNKQINPWFPGDIAPIFAEQAKFTDKPICFAPIPKTQMQNISVYAGVGSSLEEVLETGNYANIFNGFAEKPSQMTKPWTVMVYIVGSDLELRKLRVDDKGEKKGRWASQDLLEMLAGTMQSNNDKVNLVISTGGSTRYGWNTVKRSVIHNGQLNVLEDLGAKSMAESNTLTDFVLWSQDNFPAQNYALILWDHGDGTNGYGYDISEAGNGQLMSLSELHQAYQEIRAQISNPLDIVVYDACLMASIEVAEVTATVANAMAGSAELEPGHGIDYAHLMSHIGASPPADGQAFGKVVKTGYIQHTKEKGTFDNKQITYSVFDLTQLNSFSEVFKNFAIEFRALLEKKELLSYKALSRGIIRAPGYPLRQAGRLRSLDNKNIRIDLYSVLKTIGPDLPQFKSYADQLLAIIDQMVVAYDGNIANIDPSAGRVSLDIGSDKSYLTTLPEAYTLLSEALEFYSEKRKTDGFTPDGELVCPKGIFCAFAQWLELQADEILGIEAYFGQKVDSTVDIYRINGSFYQYQELTEDLELGVDGHKACQYQICVNEFHCENITLNEQGNQLLAEVLLNDSPAVLSFCQEVDKTWSACGAVSQTAGIWGRDEALYPDDRIIPYTWHLKNIDTPNNEILEQHQGRTLVIDESALVTLKETCDLSKGAISAAFYSLNEKRQFDTLCDSGDCICQEGDTDEGCQELGFRAGVILKQ